jgi:hypothetical protein
MLLCLALSDSHFSRRLYRPAEAVVRRGQPGARHDPARTRGTPSWLARRTPPFHGPTPSTPPPGICASLCHVSRLESLSRPSWHSARRAAPTRRVPTAASRIGSAQLTLGHGPNQTQTPCLHAHCPDRCGTMTTLIQTPHDDRPRYDMAKSSSAGTAPAYVPLA